MPSQLVLIRHWKRKIIYRVSRRVFAWQHLSSKSKHDSTKVLEPEKFIQDRPALFRLSLVSSCQICFLVGNERIWRPRRLLRTNSSNQNFHNICITKYSIRSWISYMKKDFVINCWKIVCRLNALVTVGRRLNLI